ncbi:MAG: formylglycine-generating enzyme family protein [Chitinophagia bacterium]|nr:formylglycine-generating enzyme family protein [Chitinophagia bacterium]
MRHSIAIICIGIGLIFSVESKAQWNNDYGGRGRGDQQKEGKGRNRSKNHDHDAAATAAPVAGFRAPKMVLVKGGGFRMGCNDNADEKPVHIVNLTDFEISAYEITVADFRRFMDSYTYVTDAEKEGWSTIAPTDSSNDTRKVGINWQYDVHGNKLPDSCENYPVTHVSWYDAIAYCKWLSKQTGRNFRLPTEAEWEYAAQGGQTHDWEKIKPQMSVMGWCARNSDGHPHRVGRKSANSLCLYDMAGNVWEWCSDWYDETYYTLSPTKSPTGPVTGTQRILRGGAWNTNPGEGSTYFWGTGRQTATPHDRGMAIGFRVVCEVAHVD